MPDQALAEANGIVLKPIHVDNSALQKTVWVKNGQTLEEPDRFSVDTTNPVFLPT